MTDDLPERPVVLTIDDDPAARGKIRLALERSEFEVIEAANCQEALAQAERNPPNVVLLDVDLPGTDGIATVVALRGRSVTADVPIIMMTDDDATDVTGRAFDAGATDFERKSVSPRVLAERVRFIWRASRSVLDLRKSEARLEAAQEMARLGNWEWDAVSGRHTWSAETRRLLGYEREAVADHDAFLAAIHPADRSRVADTLNGALRGTEPIGFDYRIVSPRGAQLNVHARGQVVRDRKGFAVGLAGTVQDVTERKKWEEQIRWLAYYDPMTGLPNRALFLERLHPALADARRRKGLAALIFMDIDNFKRVNDTLGHSAGDDLLKEVGNRVANAVRTTDTVSRVSPDDYSTLLARLGGDEFVVLLSGIRHPEDAARVAGRMIASLRRPIQIAGREVFVTASIGISTFPEDGEDLETLLKNADAAMYAAKDSGRNGFQFFDPRLNRRAAERLSLETALRRGLERGELALHYQPIVAIDRPGGGALECLLRWHHPELGMVAPSEFIPVAEESGLIEPLAEWTVREACRQQREWAAAGFRPKIAVNISPRNLLVSGVARRLGALVIDAAGEPSRLSIELTEGFLSHDLEGVKDVLHSWKELGLEICLDDFGRGYSSLGYLRELPVDVIKVDRSFVRDLETVSTARALTAAIAAMARVLGMAPLAEGVENANQKLILEQQGYRLMQGYYFGSPVPAEQVLAVRASAERLAESERTP